MSHLDEGQLTSLLDGELTASAQREAEAHLAICAECRGLYDEIRAFSVEADALVTGIELPRQPAPLPALSPGVQPRGDGAQASRRPLPWRTLGWAATLVAALGLGYLVRGMDRQPIPTDVASSKEPSGVAPAGIDSGAAASTGLIAPAAPTTAPAAGAPAELARQNTQAAEPRRDGERTAQAPETAREEAADLRARIPTSAPAPAPTVVGAAPTAELAAADQSVASAKSANRLADMSFQPVTMERAVRILGGTIRLLDGLKPERVLTGPGSLVPGAEPGIPVVRVVYEDPPGRELWLDQQRTPTDERSVAGVGAVTLLPGDTVLTVPAQGMQSVRWLDQHGFRLALTGFLPADSLRGLLQRVR